MTTKPEKDVQEQKTTGGIRHIIPFLGGIASAALLIVSGVKMLNIHSVASLSGSGTISEAFYNALGWGFIGLGIFAGVLLISIALKE